MEMQTSHKIAEVGFRLLQAGRQSAVTFLEGGGECQIFQVPEFPCKGRPSLLLSEPFMVFCFAFAATNDSEGKKKPWYAPLTSKIT